MCLRVRNKVVKKLFPRAISDVTMVIENRYGRVDLKSLPAAREQPAGKGATVVCQGQVGGAGCTNNTCY